MRSEKAFKNVFVSIISYAFLLVAGILARRLLLINFDTELVGYENLLADIFEYINIVNVGISGLLTYQFYEAFANNDNKKLNELAGTYKSLSVFTVVLSLIACIIVYFFLPIIFEEKVQFWNYFRVVYLLLSIKQVLTYFFGYWRTILASAQYEYKAVEIETVMEFISIIAKVIILYTTKNYLLYIITANSSLVLSSIFIYLKAKNQLPNINPDKISFSYIKENKIFTRIKNLLIIKINETITWSSVSLFISLLVDIKTASLFYNYLLISSMCQLVINKVIRPLRSTLADLVYKENKKVSYDFLKVMELACFFLASIILCGYMCVYQQAISVFFGEEFLLPIMFVVCFALRGYVVFKEEAIASFRNCFGDHDIEKKYSLISIAICLILVVTLSMLFKESGIILAVTISAIAIWYSNSLIVIKKFYNFSLKEYWINELKFFLLSIVEVTLCFLITYKLEHNMLNMIICAVASVCIPTITNLIVFYKNESFVSIVNLAKDLLKIKN